MRKAKPKSTGRKSGKIKFPAGWNEERVRKVIAHYDSQTEDEQAAEIEAALFAGSTTLMPVPTNLVPKVQAFIRRHERVA
jgi:hypothetical protein